MHAGLASGPGQTSVTLTQKVVRPFWIMCNFYPFLRHFETVIDQKICSGRPTGTVSESIWTQTFSESFVNVGLEFLKPPLLFII